ncbi:MAG: hypothetical protein N2511_01565 [Thermodesulfovibrionales bacterium]|nr:hypothetical protein [Thermodesulfovibrionales bacterium]
MINRIIFCLFIVIAALSLISCGGGGVGAPGFSGSDETGVIIEAHLRPYYLFAEWSISNGDPTSTISLDGNFTNAVDVIQQADCDPDPTKVVPEPMAEHSAVLVVNTKLLNPANPFKPSTLYITEYRIDYFRSTDSLGAPPIESDRRFVFIPIGVPPGKGNWYSASNVVFVDLIRKMRYVEMLNSGMYTSNPGFLNNYTAEYTFYGKDSYDKSFSFKLRHDFSMGSYNNCDLIN